MLEPVKIQIYVAHADDAELCDRLGVELIGVVVDPALRTPSSLTISQSVNAFSRISKAKKIALCMDNSLSEIMETVRETQPDILHLGCDPNLIDRDCINALRTGRKSVELMFAIPVNAPNPQAAMARLEDDADYFIFDTSDPSRPDIGATGQTHDWGVSAKLTAATTSRVVLAGGLSAENVSQAIQKVKPWAVDSFTKTNKSGGSVRKDEARLRAFIAAARGSLV